ncbi:hypothetical protein ELI_3436 [Eubacterium callanderi]|uniref:Uncharacterized protein n=1 Tax=Eubacterium callanderi TaxID=53442 RepID=E3GFR1_9FIRM|nr:hypothetical protein ELI_3436 [Eubacterium callanderi]
MGALYPDDLSPSNGLNPLSFAQKENFLRTFRLKNIRRCSKTAVLKT